VRSENKNRASLNISREVKVMLDEIRHTGQSYDGLIRELATYWRKQQRIKEAVR